MFKIKHLLDAVEKDDGIRLWIEPVGLTRDLREWCSVDQVLSNFGPPAELWEWFNDHPDGYEYFRATYHEWLAQSEHKPALQQLARAAIRENFTLVHQGLDPEHNTGVALYEFLSELASYCPPESPEA